MAEEEHQPLTQDEARKLITDSEPLIELLLDVSAHGDGPLLSAVTTRIARSSYGPACVATLIVMARKTGIEKVGEPEFADKDCNDADDLAMANAVGDACYFVNAYLAGDHEAAKAALNSWKQKSEKADADEPFTARLVLALKMLALMIHHRIAEMGTAFTNLLADSLNAPDSAEPT